MYNLSQYPMIYQSSTLNYTSVTNHKVPAAKLARYSTPTHKYNCTMVLVPGAWYIQVNTE